MLCNVSILHEEYNFKNIRLDLKRLLLHIICFNIDKFECVNSGEYLKNEPTLTYLNYILLRF